VPELSLAAQSVFRMCYGVLLLAVLLAALPHSRRFFLSERWGGYAESSWDVDVLQNPVALPLVLAVWLACGVLITLAVWTLWAAFVNLLLCRYFFVWMRWKGVLRGMGAPGFMTYWVGLAVFLLELATQYAPGLRSLALLVVQVDFALIILSSGVYKFTAGYPQNHGMELGLVNPEWGYWPKFYRRLAPGHPLIRTLNHLAWSTEVVAAVLMLIPSAILHLLGALLIVISFIFISTQIRLGVLCEMVIICALLFIPGGVGDTWLQHLIPAGVAIDSQSSGGGPAWLQPVLAVGLILYVCLLPLAHAGLYFNFYARRSLPKPLQLALDRYTNFFGIIIWRVFSVDVVNFFIRIYRVSKESGQRILVSKWGHPRESLRYSHVAESITVTSVFTTLKYYPSNSGLFHQRLLRYARTLGSQERESLVFKYLDITKRANGFEFRDVAEFTVDVGAATVSCQPVQDQTLIHAAHPVSPVHEGIRPGTYAPLGA